MQHTSIHLHKQVSVQFSRSVVSNSLWPHELRRTRPPCPSPIPGVHSNSLPSSRWCHPAISFSVIPFFSCPQSLPASDRYRETQTEFYSCCFFFLTFYFVLGYSWVTMLLYFRGTVKGLSQTYRCIHHPPPSPLPSWLPHNIKQSSTYYYFAVNQPLTWLSHFTDICDFTESMDQTFESGNFYNKSVF